MFVIVKYQTEAEAQQIISEKTAQGLILVEVSNITEGNFLGFADVAPPIPPPPLAEEINKLKQRDAQMQEDLSAIIETITGGV